MLYLWPDLKKHASDDLKQALQACVCEDLEKDRPDGSRPIAVHAYCEKERHLEAAMELISALEQLASAGHLKGCFKSAELVLHEWKKPDKDGHTAYVQSVILIDEEGRELVKQQYPKYDMKFW